MDRGAWEQLKVEDVVVHFFGPFHSVDYYGLYYCNYSDSLWHLVRVSVRAALNTHSMKNSVRLSRNKLHPLPLHTPTAVPMAKSIVAAPTDVNQKILINFSDKQTISNITISC